MRRRGDTLFVALAVAHGVLLLVVPSTLLIAIGVWWNSNTIAHNFLHRPFFRSRWLNATFAAYQSVVTAIPQTLWRDRHLAHHAGVDAGFRWSVPLAIETSLVAGLLVWLAAASPTFLAFTYLPGLAGGLVLCALHGHYEHVGAVAISHYGRFYNFLLFNDGYHVEHHASPGVPWSRLPEKMAPDAPVSRWPAVVRWLDAFSLDALERVVLRTPALQRFVLDTHRRALHRLLAHVPAPRRVLIVGGGLYPRSAILLHERFPQAELVVMDVSGGHIATCQRIIEAGAGDLAARVRYHHARFPPSAYDPDVDLIVAPLAFRGDRAALYARDGGPPVLVHDWIWRRRGTGRVVSCLLLKRINLVPGAWQPR